MRNDWFAAPSCACGILGPLLEGALLTAGFKTNAMFLFSSGAVLIASLKTRRPL
jgi:hypothetical protein